MMSLCFCKISICFSLLRVIKGTNAAILRWLLYLIMVSVFLVNGAVSTTLFAQCQPTKKIWNPNVIGVCWPPSTFLTLFCIQGGMLLSDSEGFEHVCRLIGTLAFSALTDFILSGLPIFVLKDLKVERRSKIILCFLLGVGVV